MIEVPPVPERRSAVEVQVCEAEVDLETTLKNQDEANNSFSNFMRVTGSCSVLDFFCRVAHIHKLLLKTH